MADRKRLWIALAAGFVVVIAIVVALVFQPQKLFIDDTVDEARPVAVVGSEGPATTAGGSRAPAEASPPPEPGVVVSGEFVSLEHSTSGRAEILDLGDGTRVLRIEDLDTDNGPDLFVYLSTNPADGPEGGFDDDFVNLGSLKGNVGSQNYEIPADVDVSRYRSVVIWCRRFTAAFGAAPLS